jgi:FKBP-type peptidyl-prolyl cis-trans isomerase
MPKGSKFKFTIPSNLAYGDASPSPLIPGGATLIFEVELFNIK